MKFTSELRDATCQWDHTVLSATRQRWPPRLHPNRAGWYSIYRRMKGWVGLELAGYIPKWFTRPQMVTHPSTNRVWRSATTLIEANALPLSQTANQKRVGKMKFAPPPHITTKFCTHTNCFANTYPHAEVYADSFSDFSPYMICVKLNIPSSQLYLFLCLLYFYQARLASGVIMFSRCPFAHPSVHPFVS